MKTITTLLLFLCLCISNVQAQDNTKLWEKVEILELKGEVKKANALVTKIFKKEKRNNNSKAIIKSFIYKSKFNLILLEDGENQFVEDILNEIESNSFPTNAILESIYANFLIDFYNKNKYKFKNRTRIEDNNNDIYTWDLYSLKVEIHKHLQNSISNPDGLKDIQLKNYIEILEGQTNTLKYTPTLYDFLVNNAISFYRGYIVSRGNTQNAIENVNDYFKTTNEFIALNIKIEDSLSKTYALKLYQDLERFHLKKENYYPLFNTLINRLTFLKGKTKVTTEHEYFENVIEQTILNYKSEEAISHLYFYLANYYYLRTFNLKYVTSKAKSTLKNYRKLTYKLCNATISKFPNSESAIKCKNLNKSLESQFLSIETNKVTSSLKPALAKITYANVDTVHLSAYKIPIDFLNQLNNYSINRDSIILQTIKTKKTVFNITHKLVNTKDYYKHSAEVLIPKLELGNYLIIVSNTKNIISKKDFAYQTSARSNLFVTSANKSDVNEFLVTNRETGFPIEKARITIYSKGDDYKIIKTTNTNGFARELKSEDYLGKLEALVTYKKDSLFLNNVYLDEFDEDEDEEWNAYSKLVLDRNIYRPGQDIHFKGYIYQEKDGKRSAVQNIFCSIVISDSKGNELKEFRLKTNTFGTVSGSYTLPKDILTGEFSIELDEDYDYEEDEHPFWDNVDDFEYVEKDFFVENYKRPTFEIQFDKITENYRLGDSVFVKGKAISFFKSKITNAQVKYSITRTNDYKKKAIISGEVSTDSLGIFIIPFVIENTHKATQKIKSNYTVNVDITDINGETRTSKKEITIGNYNFNLNVHIPYNPTNKDGTTIELVSKNLNEGYVESSGELFIYKVGENYSRLFKRPWQSPEFQLVHKDTFSAYFPNLEYSPLNDEKKELVYKTTFKTKDSLTLTLDSKQWKSGGYVVEGYAKDKLNSTTKIDEYFNFKNIEEEDKSTLFNYDILNYDFKKDGKAIIKLTTAFKNVYVNARIHYKNKEIDTKAFTINGDYILNIPIPEKSTGTLSVFLTSNTLGVFDSKSFDFKITENNDTFKIDTQTFRSKLEPGLKETWNFKIQALDKNVEVLASMYDESLDTFFKDKGYGNYEDDDYTLDWNSKIEPEDYYRSYYGYDITNLSENLNHNKRDKNKFVYTITKNKYLKLHYFGLNFSYSKYSNNNYLKRIKKKRKLKGELKKLGNISGVVSDENGLPMPGVSILVVGTNNGTQTDFDGFYSINAKGGDILQFSSIGYKTEEITYMSSNSINLGLEVDVTAIDEVVITALGVKRRSAISSSIHVTYNTVADFNNDVIRKLKGKVSGLQISGTYSYATKIILRGNTTVNNNSQALIIVDGIIVDSNTFTSLNPNSLDTVQVIKGASGAALYGNQGANGVVVITTKFGSKVLDTDEGKKIVDLTEKDINTIEVRKNLKETAFFYPHLKTNSNNEVNIKFTAPQALTRWKFQLLAHTKAYKYGYLKLNAITQKKLVITPNLPRFLREGDTITITGKITNLSEGKLNGNAYLELYNVETNKKIVTLNNRRFSLQKQASKELKWQVTIPENVSKLRYKMIAKTEDFSDGEEGYLEVLKQKILVTETLPLYVKGNTKKEFQFKKLIEHNSSTLQHDKLTIEYSSNPVWFTFQSLPYLMEYPYDCAEQTFSKYYANALGTHILNSNPKIKAYLKTINTDSVLNTNKKNKTSTGEETPFRKDINGKLAFLFDENKLKEQENNTLIKLKELQLSNGAFSWFSTNGSPNTFITNHIVASYGHLKKLGVTSKNQYRLEAITKKAIGYLDLEFSKRIKAKNSIENVNIIHYLYARSFFLETNTLDDKHEKTIFKYLEKLEKNWITQELYNQGLIALIFNRFNKTNSAKKVIKALDQSSITSETFGMYWKANTSSIYWYKSPIETQALLIEAFAEINNDKKRIDNMKLWLLNQKQTNNWKTTKATTEAVYALMLQGSDWITIKQNSKIKIGSDTIKNNPLGHHSIVYSEKEINPNKATIEINNTSKSPGFGGVYWQYFENLDKITSAETPLKLKKKLFKKTNTSDVITEITKGTKLEVGDLVRVRIELRSDRTMEFVHMKDMRAAGLEPINVLSEYKYQDGLGYYESTKDASTDFFFDKLPKGVYVFEYDLRVNNAGNMSNGITTIQSMYAPEFTSHSEGIRVSIGD